MPVLFIPCHSVVQLFSFCVASVLFYSSLADQMFRFGLACVLFIPGLPVVQLLFTPYPIHPCPHLNTREPVLGTSADQFYLATINTLFLTFYKDNKVSQDQTMCIMQQPSCRLCLTDNISEPYLFLLENESHTEQYARILELQTNLYDANIYPNHVCIVCKSALGKSEAMLSINFHFFYFRQVYSPSANFSEE